MNIQEEIIKIAKSLVAAKWVKFKSDSAKQGWKRKKAEGGYEYRYQDSDPNESKPLSNEKVDKNSEDADVEGNIFFQPSDPNELKKVKGHYILKGSESTFICNTYPKDALSRIKNEVFVNEMYRISSYDAEAVQITKINGFPYIIKDLVEPTLPSESIVDDFVYDCFLANTNVGKKGKIKSDIYRDVRLNNSDAFLFNADGTRRELDDEVTELKTMRDPSLNPEAAKYFANIPERDVILQISGILRVFTPKEIRKVLNAVYDLPEEEEVKEYIYQKLLKRLDYLKRYAIESSKKLNKTNKPKREPLNLTEQYIKKPLTDQEEEEIEEYTGEGYNVINAVLRGKEIDEDINVSDVEDQIKTLRNALEKLPPYKGIVRRNCSLQNELVVLVANAKPGDIIHMKGFTSTSKTDPSTWFSGMVHYRIKSRTGRDISPFSVEKDEQEVLFAPDTRFKIESIKIDKYKYYVDLEEILEDESPNKRPFNSGKKNLTPNDIRKFLLKNPKLTPKQRQRIMKLTPEELKAVIIAIMSRSKSKVQEKDELDALYL